MSEHGKTDKRTNKAASQTGTSASLRADAAMHECQELREKLRRMEAILESTRAGTWEWNVQTGETVFNEGWAEIVGYTLAELAPVSIKTWETLAHPDDLRRSGELLARHFTGESASYEFDSRMRHKDGRWVWVRDHGKVVSRTPDGQPLWMFGTHIDITDRHIAEAALRESELKFRTLVEASSAGIWKTDAAGQNTYVSARWCEMAGISEADAAGQGWASSLHPDDRIRVQTGWEAAAAGATPYVAEFRFLHPDGRLVWVDCHASPVMVGGRVTEWIGTITDITARKEAEEALRRNNKDLRESQRISHVGSWRLDVATNQVVWTEELYNMYGFDPSVPPPPYTEHMKLFTPESWERLSTALARTRETGIPYTLELETVRKDGSNGWMWVRGEADVDSTGKTVGLWGAAQDITERKRAEENLKTSEERLRLAHKATNDVVWDWDAVQDTQQWNEAGTAVFGWTEIVERPVSAHWWVERVHPDDRQRVQDSFFAVVNNPDHFFWKDDYRFARADGAWADVMDRGYVLRDENGKAIRMIGAMLDITERKRAEEKLRASEAAQQASESASRAKTQFLAKMSHEIRTPLNVISGFAKVLEREVPPDSKPAEHARTILQSSDHLLAMANNLLDVGKIESGTITLQETRSDLHALLCEMAENFRFRAAGKGLRFVFETNNSVPRQVRMDPTKLRQVVFNLLENALKFTDAGQVTMRVSAQTPPANDRPPQARQVLSIEIGDSGCGISARDLPHVFDDFFQGDTGKTFGGSGLGLPICRKLLQLMGGTIEVQSEPAKGSVFRCTVPVVVEDPIPTAVQARGGEFQTANPGGSAGPAPVRIPTREDLAKLPADLRACMLAAIGDGNMTAMRECIGKVRQIQPRLADGLRLLADHYDYASLETLLS